MKAIVAFSLVVLLFGTAFGEGVMVGRGGVKLKDFGAVDLEKTVEHWAAREEEKVAGELNLRIELLTKVCDLQEREVKKLRLAVTAVTRRRLASGREQLEHFIYTSELIKRDEKLAELNVDDKLIPYRAKSLDDGVVLIATRFERPLDQQPMWKKILKNSLSQSQWMKYEQHRSNRNLAILRVAVTAAVADLDDKVFLTQEDRIELTNQVLKDLSGKVTLDRPSSMKQAQEISGPYFEEINNLKKYLRPTQFERLTQIAGQDVRGVGWTQ